MDAYEEETEAKIVDNRPKLLLDIDENDDDQDDLDENVIGITVDDDAEEELAAILDKARRLKLKQIGVQLGTDNVAHMVNKKVEESTIKEEPMDANEEEPDDAPPVDTSVLVLDAMSEYCRNLGEIPTYGLAGNRTDAIDIHEIDGAAKDQSKKSKKIGRHKQLPDDQYELAMLRAEESAKGQWIEANDVTRGSKGDKSSDECDDERHNILGDEKDATKGVGAMLKLAAVKGYLTLGNDKLPAGPSLKHLMSKRFSVVETAKHDIDEKYTKKLERMGATGSGPIRPFNEMKDYCPSIRIDYTDDLGRQMDEKDAFRQLSWKFHGKGPGKKQIEKRSKQMLKKELMKQMNSMDTPLGMLDKQLKKHEKLQTPYIVLSGSGKETGAPLKKD